MPYYRTTILQYCLPKAVEDQLVVTIARAQPHVKKLFDAGHAGFAGGLSAKNYMRITRTSRATATRELTKLMDLGILVRTGAGRSTRYELRLEDLVP